MKMIKIYCLAIVTICSAIFICGCGNNGKQIKLVQDGYLGDDTSVTFSQALQKNMKNIEWSCESGYVTVTGVWKSDYYKKSLIDCWTNTETTLESKRSHIEFDSSMTAAASYGNSNTADYDRQQRKFDSKMRRVEEAEKKFFYFKSQHQIICDFPVKGDIVYMKFRINDDDSCTLQDGVIRSPGNDVKIEGGEDKKHSSRKVRFPGRDVGISTAWQQDNLEVRCKYIPEVADAFLNIVCCDNKSKAEVSELKEQMVYIQNYASGSVSGF